MKTWLKKSMRLLLGRLQLKCSNLATLRLPHSKALGPFHSSSKQCRHFGKLASCLMAELFSQKWSLSLTLFTLGRLTILTETLFFTKTFDRMSGCQNFRHNSTDFLDKRRRWRRCRRRRRRNSISLRAISS